MRYPRILAAIRSARWAVTPPTLQAISDSLGAHLRGSLQTRPVFALPVDSPPPVAPASEPAAPEMTQTGVAIIPVYGIIGKNLSSMETMCGGCDLQAVSAALDAAVSDVSVTSIVLDIDSPGGVVTGVPEMADKIREVAQAKRIVAFTSGQCCSAAYWIASACDAIFCTKSADLGSIGVYVALVDDSKWWENEGYKLELIKAGDFKAMGISGKPLEDAERALIQADVDAIYSMFTGDVVSGRGKIDDATMQGQTFMGQSAVDVRLADEVVTDLGALVAMLAEEVSPTARGKS